MPIILVVDIIIDMLERIIKKDPTNMKASEKLYFAMIKRNDPQSVLQKV